MQYKTVNKTRMAEHTRNGRTVQVPERYTEQVPKAPVNLDLVIRRALFVSAIVAATGAILWGTAAIGSMLAMIAPPWAAYLVAGVFDLTWVGCLAAEWLLRYDDKRAIVPRVAGMVALIVSMGALVTHGVLTGTLAVGIVGALVSAAAKGLWTTALYTVRIQLDPVDQAYLDLRKRETGTALALALGDRDRAVSDAKTAQLRLSLESATVNAAHVVEQVAVTERSAGQGSDLRIERTDQPEITRPVTERSAGQPVSDRVKVLIDRLSTGERLTGTTVARSMDVSEATGRRYLRAAKDAMDAQQGKGTGQYL